MSSVKAMGPTSLGSNGLTVCFVFLMALCESVLETLPRANEGLVNGVCLKTGLFLTLFKPELTLDACRNECLNRNKCLSLNYDKKYPLCKMYDNNDIGSNETCPGVVYMDISHWVSFEPRPEEICICLCENKGADQIARPINAFVYAT